MRTLVGDCIIRGFVWHPAALEPEDGKRVIIHVPELEKPGEDDGVRSGKFVKALNRWTIDGSPSEWDVDFWTEWPVFYRPKRTKT